MGRMVVVALWIGWLGLAGLAQAQTGVVDLPPGGSVAVQTTVLPTPVSTAFGAPSDPKTVFRLGPLAPGRRYQVTFTYDAGGDVGFAHSWVDGNPFGRDWHSFVGIGTGTGTRPMPGKEAVFQFSVDRASTARTLHVVLRTSVPFAVKARLTEPSPGLSPQTQDRWGYFYVSDFDADRTSPFLLKRGGEAPPPSTQVASGPWIEVPVNGSASARTAVLASPVANAFGAAADPKTVFRLGPLAPGRRYEVIFTYDAGGDVGFAHSWVDGSPFGRDWHSFVGIGTGTGTRPMPGKEARFLFTVASGSTSHHLFIVLRTSQPFPVKVGLTDRLSGLTPQSQDRWGYYYVTDFDADRTAPFLLKR